jgi:hypothetical protein
VLKICAENLFWQFVLKICVQSVLHCLPLWVLRRGPSNYWMTWKSHNVFPAYYRYNRPRDESLSKHMSLSLHKWLSLHDYHYMCTIIEDFGKMPRELRNLSSESHRGKVWVVMLWRQWIPEGCQMSRFDDLSWRLAATYLYQTFMGITWFDFSEVVIICILSRNWVHTIWRVQTIYSIKMRMLEFYRAPFSAFRIDNSLIPWYILQIMTSKM